MSGQTTSQLLILAKFFLYAWFHCVSCTVYSNWKAGFSLLLLFCALFLLFLLFLVCWHLLLLFPNWLSPPFQPGLKHLNIWFLIISINSRKMKMPSLKWTRMRFFELRLGLPVLAPPWGELLSSPDSGKSSLWTPGSPVFRLGPGRISGKKQRGVQLFDCSAIVWGKSATVLQFLHLWVANVARASSRSTTMHCDLTPSLSRILLIIPPFAYWRSSQINMCSEGIALPCLLKQSFICEIQGEKFPPQNNGSHLKNQVDCFPAHELRRGHPSKLFLVDKPVEVDVKQSEKHPWFILLALMNIATAPRKTNLNAVTATLCQYWSLSLSNALNWSPMFSCLMCRMKSFFRTWKHSDESLKVPLMRHEIIDFGKVWSCLKPALYLAIRVGDLPELVYVLLGQLDAIGVAHQDVLFNRDRSIPSCVGFLKELTQCWNIYGSVAWIVILDWCSITYECQKKTKTGQNFGNGSHLRDLYDRLACLVSEFLVYLIGGAQRLLFVYPSPTELAITTMYSPLSLSLSLSRFERHKAKRLKILTFMLAPAPDVLGDDRDHVEPWVSTQFSEVRWWKRHQRSSQHRRHQPALARRRSQQRGHASFAQESGNHWQDGLALPIHISIPDSPT